MTATKRIPVSPETWHQLGRMKDAGQSYDELLHDMMLAYNREQLARMARKARKGADGWVALEDVG